MQEIELPTVDLTKAALLFERRASGLYVPTFQRGTDSAAHVADVGRAAQDHNRRITGVAQTQASLGHMTWEADEGVYAVRFRPSPSVGAPADGDIIRVVFDSSPVNDTTDDTQAWNWLQQPAASESTDVEYREFEYRTDASGAPLWSETFKFASPLRRADFHYPSGVAGTTEMGLKAEADS